MENKKDERWIEESKKEIRMQGKACDNCSNKKLLIDFPMIYSEKESQGKKAVFNCSICKLKAVKPILKSKKASWFYVTKNQKLIV